MRRLGLFFITLILGLYILHPAMHLLEHHDPTEVAVEYCLFCESHSTPVKIDCPLKPINSAEFVYQIELFQEPCSGFDAFARSRGPPSLSA